jgi:hypothetical protein
MRAPIQDQSAARGLGCAAERASTGPARGDRWPFPGWPRRDPRQALILASALASAHASPGLGTFEYPEARGASSTSSRCRGSAVRFLTPSVAECMGQALQHQQGRRMTGIVNTRRGQEFKQNARGPTLTYIVNTRRGQEHSAQAAQPAGHLQPAESDIAIAQLEVGLKACQKAPSQPTGPMSRGVRGSASRGLDFGRAAKRKA